MPPGVVLITLLMLPIVTKFFPLSALEKQEKQDPGQICGEVGCRENTRDVGHKSKTWMGDEDTEDRFWNSNSAPCPTFFVQGPAR